MGRIKINEELFLGRPELERLVRFLGKDGLPSNFRPSRALGGIISSYGFVKDLALDPSFGNLKLVPGNQADTVTLNSGIGIDNDDEIFFSFGEIDVATIPTDGTWTYFSIKRTTTNVEEGTVEISSSGQLTGTGTRFLEVLRGQPNFPSTIKFPNSSLNTGEYEIVQVNSDTSASIAGNNIQAESGLDYVVVGTFTPGVPIPSGDKDIFVYDDVEIESFSSLSALQSNLQSGKVFALARAKSDGSTVEVEDMRNDFLETKGSWELRDISDSNPLAFTPWVQYDVDNSPKDRNIARFEWGFEGTSWTFDPVNLTLSISSGSGGVYSDPSDASAGDFDGWLVQFEGTDIVAYVRGSSMSGSNIVLSLQPFDTQRYYDQSPSGSVRLAPNASTINVRAIPFGNEEEAYVEESFSIFNGTGAPGAYIGLKPLGSLSGDTNEYEISYSLRWAKVGTAYTLMNNGDYRDEDGNTKTSSSSVIEVQLHEGNHEIDKASLSEANTWGKIQRFSLHGSTIDVNSSNELVLPDGGNHFNIADGNGVNIVDFINGSGPQYDDLQGAWITLHNVSSSSIVFRDNSVNSGNIVFPTPDGYAAFVVVQQYALQPDEIAFFYVATSPGTISPDPVYFISASRTSANAVIGQEWVERGWTNRSPQDLLLNSNVWILDEYEDSALISAYDNGLSSGSSGQSEVAYIKDDLGYGISSKIGYNHGIVKGRFAVGFPAQRFATPRAILLSDALSNLSIPEDVDTVGVCRYMYVGGADLDGSGTNEDPPGSFNRILPTGSVHVKAVRDRNLLIIRPMPYGTTVHENLTGGQILSGLEIPTFNREIAGLVPFTHDQGSSTYTEHNVVLEFSFELVIEINT